MLAEKTCLTKVSKYLQSLKYKKNTRIEIGSKMPTSDSMVVLLKNTFMLSLSLNVLKTICQNKKKKLSALLSVHIWFCHQYIAKILSLHCQFNQEQSTFRSPPLEAHQDDYFIQKLYSPLSFKLLSTFPKRYLCRENASFLHELHRMPAVIRSVHWCLDDH